MKTNLIKILSLGIAILMLLSFSACQKKAAPPEEESAKESYKPASEFGVTEYGWISVSSMLGNEDLLDWFEKSLSRSSVTYAVLYAKDAKTNVWYCWFYAEGYNYGDTVTLSVDDTNGTHVHIDVAVTDPDADATGTFCFAVPGESEPTFSVTADGVPEGLIVTLGDAPILPLK